MKNNRQQRSIEQLWKEKMEVKIQCQELEQQIKIDLQYISTHAGELLWNQLNSLLLPPTILDPENTERKRLTWSHGFRFLWRMIRPMTYYWLGDLGWHLFKLWFKRWFKKKERRTSD